jgi:DNA sulfur modification protein DndB
LLKIAYVFRHSSEIPGAYQRILKLDRIKNIRKFLRKRWASLPNNIIINFHEKVYFKRLRYYRRVAIGILTIPMKFCSAWVIDGQHRLYGFTKTPYVSQKYEGFDIIVVGFRKLSIDKQTTMFVNINREQKKISSNLLYSLILNLKPKARKEIPTKDNISRALELTKEIAKTKYWKGKIAFKETQGDRPITITMFATYKLSDLLKKNGVLYRYSSSLNVQLKLLKKYFSIIAEIYGDKWDNRDYVLTTQIGVNTLFILLEKILEFCEKKNDFSLLNRGKLIKYLSPLPQIVSFKKDEYGQFTSGVGWRILANKIIKKLNKTEPTIKLSLVKKKGRK